MTETEIKLKLSLGEKLTTEQAAFLISEMNELRESRLVLDRESKRLKDHEVNLNSLLIDRFSKEEVNNVESAGFTWCISDRTDEPHVGDWEVFWNYIHETKNFSLLEKRPASAPIKEMWAAGQSVPGVEKYPVYKLLKSKD